MQGASLTTPPGEPPRAVIDALRRVLRPLTRLLIAHGITLPLLSELMKSVYVEVAERSFPVPGRPASDSRISLLTGVHRKDVRRLRGAAPGESLVPATVSLGSQLVAKWVAERRYLDRAGAPRPLPLRKGHGAGASFEELVASVSRQDLRARVVLDELLRLGIVEIDTKDRVQLRVEAFVPVEGLEEKAYYFGRNLADHIAAGTHNLLGERPAFLERGVSYHGLSDADVNTLGKLALDHAMATLKVINRRALGMQRRQAGREGPKRRMNFGVFFYAEDDDPEPRDASHRDD